MKVNMLIENILSHNLSLNFELSCSVVIVPFLLFMIIRVFKYTIHLKQKQKKLKLKITQVKEI